MRKVSILKRRIYRAYNNKKNKEYSTFKGYPIETYFGYSSLRECVKETIKDFKEFYGNSLRKFKLC